MYRVYKWFSRCGRIFSFFMYSMCGLFQQHRKDPTALHNNFTEVGTWGELALAGGDLRCHGADLVKPQVWFNLRSWAKCWDLPFTVFLSFSVTAGGITVVWPLRVTSNPAVETLIRTCMCASVACVCVCVCSCAYCSSRCVTDPEVSVTASCSTLSQPGPADAGPACFLSILSYVTLSSESLASQSSPWRFGYLIVSSICWRPLPGCPGHRPQWQMDQAVLLTFRLNSGGGSIKIHYLSKIPPCRHR